MLYLGNLLGLFIPYDFCFLPNTNLVLSFVPRFIPAILVVIITFIFFYFKRFDLVYMKDLYYSTSAKAS